MYDRRWRPLCFPRAHLIRAMPSTSSHLSSASSPPPTAHSRLSYWELCKAYNLHESYCSPASTISPQRAKCRPFPNCLHGLKAKRGIHATPPPLLRSLGADPAARVRRPGQLVGLTNLGATCYLNTLLQCLFMNSHFRHSIYRYRSPPAQSGSSDGVVLLLQQLFGLMEYGPQLYESPAALVRELELKPWMQQDVNEFNHLFLSTLEGCLKDCATGGEGGGGAESVRRLVASEFAGETVSTVRCSECGHSSQRASSFVDVSLQIRGAKTLQDCLAALTEPEQLTAHNAYFCARCAGKREAQKQTRFSSLPPVLNLQLIRFHYDVESGQKKKLNDRIFLPYRLSMAPYMAAARPADEAERYEYELTGVLRHKGASAHRGHYTCEVRDAKGKWWIFDDDKVGLGGDTFSARGDAAGAQVREDKGEEGKEGGEAALKAGKKKRRKGGGQTLTMKKQRKVEKDAEEAKGQHKMTDYMGRSAREDDDDEDDVVMVDADDREDEREGEKKEAEGERGGEEVVLDEKRAEAEGQRKGVDGDSSANAYMLVYTLRSRVTQDAEAAAAASQRRANSSQQADTAADSNSNLPSAAVTPPSFICDCHTDCQPPQSVRKAIEASAAKLNDDIRLYNQRRQLLMEKIEQRTAEVDELLDILDAPPITQQTAAEYERQHKHPNRSRPPRPLKPERPEQVVLDDDEEAVAEPFNFVHVGWLQRWLNGQTEREWSDEAAERAVAELRGRGTKAKVVEGGEKGDAIVLDEEDGSETARESPTPQHDSGDAVIILSDDDEQRSSSPTDFATASPSLSTPPPSSSSSAPLSASSTSQIDTDDPLWPGDIFESCARLQCPHGKLDPRLHKQRLAKRISSAAWSKLMQQNADAQRQRAQFLVDAGLPPPPQPASVDLDDNSLCVECVAELQAESDELSAQRGKYEALLEGMKEFTHTAARSQAAFKDGQLSQSGMLLDREWYKQFADQVRKWKAKAYSSVPLPATHADDVNKGLICSHGHLRVHFDQHAFLISPRLWTAFTAHYPSSTSFSARSPVCDECAAADKSDSNRRDELALRLTRELDKHKFGNLLRQRHDSFPDPKRPPHATKPQQPYFLLPARWVLHKLQPYHEQATADSSKPLLERPPPAPMGELFCEHGQLKVHPVPKGVGGELEGIDKGDVTYCEASAWKGLVECGYVEGGEQCATMTVRDVLDDSTASSEPWLSVRVDFDPKPCDVCIKARQQLENQRLHQFTRGSVTVRRVPITTPIGSSPSTTTSSSSDQLTFPGTTRFAAPAPTSPRSRSRRKRAYTVLEELSVYDVNCEDDVATLKMKISQYCTHNPAHMRLFWRDAELLEGKRLSEYGVTDGGELILKVDAQAGGGAWSVDYMDYLPTDDSFVSGDVESGFAGTRLGGGGGGGGGGEGKKAKEARMHASTAVPERKEEEPKGEPSKMETEERKEESPRSRGSVSVASTAATSAPILPRIDAPHAVSSATLSTETAGAATAAAAPLANAIVLQPANSTTDFHSPARHGKSAFLASLDRGKADQQLKPAHSRAQSEERKEAAVAHDADDDMRLAMRLQEQFNAEEEAKEAAPSSTAARQQRIVQEEKDRALALQFSQQARRGRSAHEEEEEGEGKEGEEEVEAEDNEDEDGDYSEADERKERKRKQAKSSAKQPKKRAARPARGSGGGRGGGAAGRGGGRKAGGRQAVSHSEPESVSEVSESDLDDEVSASDSDNARGRRGEQPRPKQRPGRRAAPAPNPPPPPTEPVPKHLRIRQAVMQSIANRPPPTHCAPDPAVPFVCDKCTFVNANGGAECAECGLERARVPIAAVAPHPATFVCVACTYHNPVSLTQCEMCNAPRASARR